MGQSATCSRPPLGWKCSRPPGHEGPCAATYDFGDRHPFGEAQLDRVKRGVVSIEEGEAFCEAVRDLLAEQLRYRAALVRMADVARAEGTDIYAWANETHDEARKALGLEA